MGARQAPIALRMVLSLKAVELAALAALQIVKVALIMTLHHAQDRAAAQDLLEAKASSALARLPMV